MDAETQSRLARRFAGFARECEGSSPLYQQLSQGVAADPDPALLELASVAPPGQPLPNLLYAAAHLLLLEAVDDPLAAYYPSAGGTCLPDGEAYPLFRAFCLARHEALAPLLRERLVQTNEARRCALLLPAFALAARFGGGRPLALIEIGASAGLNLLWDRYGYRYSDGRRAGVARSPVQLACALEGELTPPLPATLPAVATRTGVDLNPIVPANRPACRWLRALIWPEHQERAALLEAALAAARRDPPRVLAGDALALLPALLASAAPGATPVLFHSQTVNQFSEAARQALRAIIDAEGRRRPLVHIALEADDPPAPPALRWASYRDGAREERLLARCDAHGRWLRWLDAG